MTLGVRDVLGVGALDALVVVKVEVGGLAAITATVEISSSTSVIGVIEEISPLIASLSTIFSREEAAVTLISPPLDIVEVEAVAVFSLL